jgi:DNA/RNA-binding domain of Phe-tRNA-synthetase-like protein
MVSLDIAGIAADFPAYRVALVVAEGIKNAPARPAALAAEIAEVESGLRARLTGVPLSQVPELDLWREAYKAFGIRKTSYRSSVERLVRLIVNRDGLPKISAFVDAYNLISARHLLPLGADDLAQVEGELAFRYSRAGDSFQRLGSDPPQEEPPKPGEVVYADQEKVLCRRWNWSQDRRSAVTLTTHHAVLTVQSLGASGAAEAAAEDLCAALERHCGARTRWTVASAEEPRVAVEGGEKHRGWMD